MPKKRPEKMSRERKLIKEIHKVNKAHSHRTEMINGVSDIILKSKAHADRLFEDSNFREAALGYENCAHGYIALEKFADSPEHKGIINEHIAHEFTSAFWMLRHELKKIKKSGSEKEVKKLETEMKKMQGSAAKHYRMVIKLLPDDLMITPGAKLSLAKLLETPVGVLFPADKIPELNYECKFKNPQHFTSSAVNSYRLEKGFLGVF